MGVFHREQFTLVEGDFLQRVETGPLYGYRVGFGVYDGYGQSLEAFVNLGGAGSTATINAATLEVTAGFNSARHYLLLEGARPGRALRLRTNLTGGVCVARSDRAEPRHLRGNA